MTKIDEEPDGPGFTCRYGCSMSSLITVHLVRFGKLPRFCSQSCFIFLISCSFTAGLRHVETTMVPNPVLEDPLALHLCGSAALALAMKELEDLTAAQVTHINVHVSTCQVLTFPRGMTKRVLITLTPMQGSGKHLRVPARTRLLDDRVADALQKIAHNSSNGLSSSSGQAHHLANVQIVALGCGMDTRPWRLPLHEDKSGCVVSW